jgi:hypothetical protein
MEDTTGQVAVNLESGRLGVWPLGASTGTCKQNLRTYRTNRTYRKSTCKQNLRTYRTNSTYRKYWGPGLGPL